MRFEYKPANSNVTILFTDSMRDANSYNSSSTRLGIHILGRKKVNVGHGAYCGYIHCDSCPLNSPNFPGLGIGCSSAAQYLLSRLSLRYSKTKELHG